MCYNPIKPEQAVLKPLEKIKLNIMERIEMKNLVLLVFCVTSFCLAQETYYNEEYRFTVDIPLNWDISLEDEWPEELKTTLKGYYLSKAICMLNPSGIEISSSPCIRVFGGLEDGKSRFRSNYIIQNGEKILTRSINNTVNEVTGDKIKQYRKVDSFYDYDSSKSLIMANILYKHNKNDSYFIVTIAKFFGRAQSISFQGFSSGNDHEEFWQLFKEVVNSYKVKLIRPKTTDSTKIEQDAELQEEKSNQIWKWGGAILGILVILGFVKMFLFR